MKVLLDECVPRKLGRELTGHEAITIAAMGWRGVKNGELLRRMSAEGFGAMLTADKNLPYQQNASKLPFAIIVLDAYNNSLVSLRPCIPSALRALAVAKPGEVHVCKAE